jgi:hypothetical protein
MPLRTGFSPTFDGYIRFTTGSFAVSRSVGSSEVSSKLFHNLEWMYGTHTQIRVNWTANNGLRVGTEAAPLVANSASLLYSDGPFPLSFGDDGSPMPLYVRVEAGPNTKAGETVTGSLIVHLRQADLINQVFYQSEVGEVEIIGEHNDKAVYEFTTVSSSLSTSSSLLEIQGVDVRPYKSLPIRTTRSLGVTDEQARVLMCWLDFYGKPDDTTLLGTDGFAIYSVFASEVCVKVDD